jgi:hypothetical protein
MVGKIIKSTNANADDSVSTLPHAFTEQGVAMLSAVLRSQTAIQTSISIMNAFVAMRQFVQTNGALLQRMDALEIHHLALAQDTHTKFEKVFTELADKNNLKPAQGVFFGLDNSALKVMDRVRELLK